jgi:hypothetical protein
MRTHSAGNRKTTALVDAALAILSEKNFMTIRQLFYRLVFVRAVPYNLASYQLVSRVMTKCGDDGRCPFEWIHTQPRGGKAQRKNRSLVTTSLSIASWNLKDIRNSR